MTSAANQPTFEMDRIKREIADSFDEELEMEIDESRLETMYWSACRIGCSTRG